jgi:uncharacterized protein
MAGALATAGAGYAFARWHERPIFAARYVWPIRNDIDQPLILGSIVFGIGWGVVGLCPGPALENLASSSPRVIVFVLAMIAGMIAKDLWKLRVQSITAIENPAGATSRMDSCQSRSFSSPASA